MTTLQITPNFKSKTARFKGTVAAGEHVSVTIQNDDGSGETYISDTTSLRLRVVDPRNGATLAQFPEPAEGDVLPSVAEAETSWDEDVSPLRCVINLNTVQMLRAVPPAANVQLLVVLDDFENSTLYFKDLCEMTHWPRRRGEEEPVDLDGYVDIVAEFGRRLSEAEASVESAAASAGVSAQAAVEASDAASSAATAATDAQTGAIASKNAAQAAAQASSAAEIGAQQAEDGAQAAQAAAETAQAAAETAQERAEEAAGTFSVDPTLSTEGVAADAKAAGDRIADVAGDVEELAADLSYETAARELLDGAMQVDRTNLANEISRAQGAEQSLESRKANKSEVYNKTEVDSKIAGVHAFKKYLVQTLPDADEADIGGLYLVPTGETSEEGDLCEEWTVVEEDGEKRWERIGAKTVDTTLDDAVTRTSANGVKSSGIWAAIWGALAALPTGFSSLYDLCVSQLAGKKNNFDVGNGLVETSNTLYAYRGVDGTTTEGELRYTIGPADVGSAVYSWNGSATIPTGETVKTINTTTGRIYTVSFPNPVYYDRSAADDIARPDVISIDETVVAKKSDVVPTSRTVNGKALTGNVTLTADDVDALPAEHAAEGRYDLTNIGIDDLNLPIGTHVNGETPILSGDVVAPDSSATSGKVADAEATYQALENKQDALTAQQLANIAAVPNKLDKSGGTVTGSLNMGDNFLKWRNGNLIYWLSTNGLYIWDDGDDVTHSPSHIIEFPLASGTLALTANIPYNLVAKTISNGAVTLDDRAMNAVAVSSSLASLTINFPTATSGRVRDFGLRLSVASGITTAPELVLPQGVVCENADGEVPEIGADGAATILYFTETAANTFLVKGEVVTAIS